MLHIDNAHIYIFFSKHNPFFEHEIILNPIPKRYIFIKKIQ